MTRQGDEGDEEDEENEKRLAQGEATEPKQTDPFPPGDSAGTPFQHPPGLFQPDRMSGKWTLFNSQMEFRYTKADGLDSERPLRKV
jgi:hypothetical protein